MRHQRALNLTRTKRSEYKSAVKAPTKHQVKTEQTRTALLRSARKIFVRDGFLACRIEDVAADAGYTRGAFYANFASKEELFFALMQQEADKHATRIHAILREHKDVKDRLAALRSYYMNSIADRDWGMLTLEFKLLAIRQPELRPAFADKLRRIRSSMKLEVITDTLGINKPDELVRAVLEGFVAALVLEHMFDPNRVSKSEAAELLAEVFDSFVAR